MVSILRPTPAQRTRRLVVAAAAVFAVVVPLLQSLTGFGLSQAEFAAAGNSTLRVEGYAFSIWGLLYAGILAYAVWQVLPNTAEGGLVTRFGLPSAVTFFGIGLWIIMSALNLQAASVIVIFASLLALLVPLVLFAGPVRNTPVMDRERMLVIWPLAALAGWLTVAAPLNLITAATALGKLPDVMSPVAWALTAIVVTSLVAVAVTFLIRTLAYPLPVAWGLIGAFVAEQDIKPVVGFTALAAALLLVVFSVIFTFSLRKRAV